MAGRHVDVGHEQVRPVGQALAQEIVGVAGPSHHLEPSHGKHSRDALAEEGVVLTDHDAPRRSHRSERTAVRRLGLLGGEPAPQRRPRQIGLEHVHSGTVAGISRTRRALLLSRAQRATTRFAAALIASLLGGPVTVAGRHLVAIGRHLVAISCHLVAV
ncbi:MAG TPA: hypothetical protein VFY45_02975 [Baekduia sp.]|nr:hypothetical protein [Baekduia sp.]